MTDPLHILIGGHGFMGGAFAAHLARTGREALSLGRGDQIAARLDDTQLGSSNRRCVVVDFAYTSVPNSSFSDPVGDYSDNLRNVLHHVGVVQRLPLATYIYVSSGGTVYGNPAAHVPIDEEHRNIPLAPYGITKLACERYALMYQQVYGLDVRIVRPSNVYGPGQRPFRGQGIVATVMARLMGGHSVQVYGDGSTVRDYLYVDDFCTALDDVIAAGDTGEIYNVGSGVGIDITQLLALIGNEIGVEPIVERLPPRPFDVRYNVLDSRRLISLRNWQPAVSTQVGLARTAAWLTAWLKEAETRTQTPV